MRYITTVITWNRVKVLEKTIESLKKMGSLSDLLIVDNCSVDGTIEYCKKNNYEVIKNQRNLGIFMATRLAWLEAVRRGYDFILNLQDDFPCIRKVYFNDLAEFMSQNRDVGFIRLNNKSRMIKIHGDGRKTIKFQTIACNKFNGEKLKYSKFTKFNNIVIAKFNFHFNFNPNFFHSSLVEKVASGTSQPREMYIMKQFDRLGLLAATTKKPCFETILRNRRGGWTH